MNLFWIKNQYSLYYFFLAAITINILATLAGGLPLKSPEEGDYTRLLLFTRWKKRVKGSYEGKGSRRQREKWLPAGQAATSLPPKLTHTH